MSAAVKRAHEAETTFINEWADYHRMDFGVQVAKFGKLGEDGEHDALDILEVLRNGSVVTSDMDEDHGLWTVVGETVDEVVREICVRVRSGENQVEIVEMAEI